MIDYINILNNIDTKLSTFTLDNMIHQYLPDALIIAFIFVIMLILLILIAQRCPEICLIISALSIMCWLYASVNKSTHNQPDSVDLVKYSSENLQRNEIYEPIDINNAVAATNILNKIKNAITDNTNQNEFTIPALLEYGNINSLNNFYSNIIYLDNYYKNNYTEESEYEWINKILNEFYKPDNTNQATTNVDILQELKN